MDSAVILIDDTCTLCNSSVSFIVKHGGRNLYRFKSIYSDEGKQYLRQYGFPEGYDESLVLLENKRAYVKSEAVLRISRKLDGVLPLLYAFIIIPRFLRDAVYMFVSRHRHRHRHWNS